MPIHNVGQQRVIYLQGILKDFLNQKHDSEESVQSALAELGSTIVTEDLLRATKIGHAINHLRNSERASSVTRRAAGALLTTWKQMITSQRKAAIHNKETVIKPIASPQKRKKEEENRAVKRKMTFEPAQMYRKRVQRRARVQLPTLQEICIGQLRENVHLIGQWRGLQLDQKTLLSIFKNTKSNDLWRICSLNPQWIKNLDPLWERICQKEVMDKSLPKQTTWFETFELWQKKVIEKQERCRELKKRFESKTRRETRHVVDKAGVRKFVQNGRKRRFKTQQAPRALSSAKPIFRGKRTVNVQDWRQGILNRTKKKKTKSKFGR